MTKFSSRFRNAVLALPIAAAAILAAPSVSRAQSVMHTKNSAGKSYDSVLTGAGATFTTDFKGTGDVTVTLKSGGVTGPFTVSLPASPGNNPSYLSNFIGTAAAGTGDGKTGDMTFAQINTPDTIDFAFSDPLTSGDVILIGDVDQNESYKIQAWSTDGSFINLATGLTLTNYTGGSGVVPNGAWATWSTTAATQNSGPYATLSGASGNGTFQLSALTANTGIARIEITAGSTGQQAAVQFISSTPAPVAEPGILITSGSMAGMVGSGLLYGRRRRKRHTMCSIVNIAA